MKARREDIRQNLADAGCGAEQIETFLALERMRCRCEQYRLLSCHRSALLERLHREQRQIDCLDHLIYTMRQADQTRQEDDRHD